MTPEDLALCEPADPDDLPADWLAERKLDGIRAYAANGRLFSRSGREITRQFPEIDPPADTVDGELVATGRDLGAITGRSQLTNSFDIEVRSQTTPARLMAFDVLAYDGEDCRDLPLADRAGRLHAAVQGHRGVQVVEPHDDPAALWERAVANDWEGIVVKDPTAPYHSGRSDRWLKAKTWTEDRFAILDYERTPNDGFVILVDAGADDPQKVVVNGEADQRAVAGGAVEAEVQYLERSKNDRLRKPSVKRIV